MNTRIKLLCASVALTTIGCAVIKHQPETPPTITIAQPVDIEKKIENVSTFKRIDTSAISGKNMSNLNAWILGYSGEVEKQTLVDFHHSLDKLWNRKLDFDNVSRATEKSADLIKDRYRADQSFTTLSKFTADANIEAYRTRLIDYPKLCKKLAIDTARCQALEYNAQRIDGKMLIAYGMTEIFPSHDGNFNTKFLDILLRNAGETYVNSIPALGDNRLSFGFYQFTRDAVRHDFNIEGASVVSLYAPAGSKISGSVVKLTNDEQHRAAAYFAVYNMARLVKSLSRSQLGQFKQVDDKEIVAFVATAHHLPTAAIGNMKESLDKNRSINDTAGPALRAYSKKTINNYNAIKYKLTST